MVEAQHKSCTYLIWILTFIRYVDDALYLKEYFKYLEYYVCRFVDDYFSIDTEIIAFSYTGKEIAMKN